MLRTADIGARASYLPVNVRRIARVTIPRHVNVFFAFAGICDYTYAPFETPWFQPLR